MRTNNVTLWEMICMKRILAFVLALALCMGLSAAASASTFTPSAENKGVPNYVPLIDENTGRIAAGLLVGDNVGEDAEFVYTECLILTAVKDVDDATISEEAKTALEQVYTALKSGEMEFPFEMLDSEYADHLVIRDLFDVSVVCTCGDDRHHKELEKEGVSLELKFDIGIAPGAKVYVTVYKGGRWQEIEQVINNGDGTITCIFEHLCPVAIVVEEADSQGGTITGTNTNTGNAGSNSPWNPKTGDFSDQNLMLWAAVMFASAGALVLLAFGKHKKQK